MPEPIEIDGIIGWDVMAADVRAALAKAGAEAEIHINSPGGDIHEGVAIANAMRQYRRDGGKINGRVTGIAASMASYIATFTDRLEVEDNTVMMVHNPWTIALGDHRVMAKAADVLSSLRALLAKGYANRTGRGIGATLAEMDEETWLFGEEIVGAGYADAVTASPEGVDDREGKAQAMALVQTAFASMRAKLKDREADAAQLDRIAAMLPQPAAPSALTDLEKPMAEPKSVADAPNSADPTPAPALTQQDITAAVTDAAASAVAGERKRIADITRACGMCRMADKAQAWIDDGTSIEVVREKLIDAVAARAGPEMRNAPDPVQEDSFDSLVQQAMASGKSRGQAMRAVITAHPEHHRAWLARVNAA